MKIKFLLPIVMLAGMAIVYSACKKSDSSPAGPALTESQVTTQVVLDLNSALFGEYGGVNFGEGMQGPSSFGAKHLNGPKLHDLSNPFCGLVIDTAINASVTAGKDSTLQVSGHIKFSFSCSNDNLTGFSTNDDLSIAISTPELTATSKLQETLTLAISDINDANSPSTLKGTLNSTTSYKYKTGNKSGTRAFNYIINNIVLGSGDDDDILSGTISFSTKGTGSKGSWNFTGTITFLGNHQAKVSIHGKTYNVDIRTGVVV